MAINSAHKRFLNIWPLAVYYGLLFVALIYLSVIHSSPVPQEFQKPHFQVSLNISAGISRDWGAKRLQVISLFWNFSKIDCKLV